MSTASLSLIDAVGEHFIYSPSSPLFPVVYTSFEHHTLCEDCGCTPCIVSYLPDIAQEDIAAEELSQCLRFPYVSLFGVWVKYVCGFATRFPSLTVPTMKWSGALKNAIAYINGVVLPAIHGVHRLFGYHFPNEFCNYWGKDKSEVTDLDELVHWSHWNYADFVDECQTKQYCYGELCVLLVRNIYFMDTESPKVRLPITKWIGFVETMRKVGTFQVLLQLVEKAKLLLPVSANSLSMREIDQYPQCIAHIGHLNYCGVSGIIPIHINVIVAPWQIRGYAPFEGDLEISKAFSKCIRMMEPWVRKLSVSNVWYFAPYALALDSGTRTYDAECLDCIITASTMYRDAQDYDMRSILGWRGFLAYRYPVEDAYPAGIVTHWLSAMASEETAIDHISMDGVWKCLHRPDEDFDFGSYVALREGLGRISLDNTVQVRMMTPSGVMTRGGAKAIQEALCTPTTGCCCQDRGPACNSMGVMLR